MSKTTADVHEANNAVIAAAKAAAELHGVDMVIAVCGMSGDGSTVTIGVDSHGERELMLGACAGGAALKRADALRSLGFDRSRCGWLDV